MVRNALKDGLLLDDKLGTNPFVMGFIGSTGTHSAHDNGASGDVFGKCCIDPAQEAFYSPTIQERAWSSPIWYRARSEN
jgi:hypothetical protein